MVAGPGGTPMKLRCWASAEEEESFCSGLAMVATLVAPWASSVRHEVQELVLEERMLDELVLVELRVELRAA